MSLSFQGQRVTVMGLGTFGGGLGAVRFLVAQGATVTVTDLRTEAELARSLAQLADTPPARLRLGGHDPADFETADWVVVSPAVPRESPWLARAVAAGVPLTSEIELFWQFNRGQVLAVTGSNGKSTTTSLVQALVSRHWPTAGSALAGAAPRESRRVWLGGNIGHSLLPEVGTIAPDDWVVLELSSFQLETLAPLAPRPRIAVVTNFSPNHLDRHGTLATYRAAKQTLLRHQQSDDWVVRNADDDDVAGWPSGARPLWFSLHDRDDLGAGVFWNARRECGVIRWGGREWSWPVGEWSRLPGRHNRANLLAALAATLPGEPVESELRQAVGQFRGLPHRLEEVAHLGEVRFINDSKATTPAASALAVAAFREPVVLLAGGYDKQVDLTPLVDAALEPQVVGVAWLGQTGPRLAELRGARTGGSSKTLSSGEWDRRPERVCDTLAAAFHWALDQLPRAATGRPRGVVLLSPGCASYDWFENYEARGDLFRQLAVDWVTQSRDVPQVPSSAETDTRQGPSPQSD